MARSKSAGRSFALLCLVAGTAFGAPLPHLASTGAAVLRLTDATVGGAPAGDLTATTAGSGARKQWKAGITGQGVDVAVIDSGVTPVAGLSAPGKVVYGPAFTQAAADPA